MRAFAHLLDRLSLTASRDAKLTLARDFLRDTPDPDRGWALAILTGAVAFKAIRPAALRAAAEARIDGALFGWSYDAVGDLAETVALVWPARPGANRPPELSEVVEALGAATHPQALPLIEGWLDALDADGRWLLLKLAAGALRPALSAPLARRAAADLGGAAVAEVEEIWHAQAPPYGALFAWLEGRGPRPGVDAAGGFRPVMLARTLDEAVLATLDPAAYAAEWRWQGPRVQAVSEGGTRRLYSRAGDDIGAAFPDVLAALDFEGVIDAELVILRDPATGTFGDVQPRLSRGTAGAALLASHPAGLRAYDLLAARGVDLRARPLSERRACLEALAATGASPRLVLSPLVAFDGWADLARLRADSPPGDARAAAGLMLKRWDSPYLAGRPEGAWLKWTRAARRLEAVLMYVQKGQGPGLRLDLTFGVWRRDAAGAATLVPVGKAEGGLGDEDQQRLDAFVKANTVERFGPVRAVRAEQDFGLVLEVAFEGLRRAGRRKSGLVLRRPRIQRPLWDKPAGEADDLAMLERMLEG